jgi:hypothetical protein
VLIEQTPQMNTRAPKTSNSQPRVVLPEVILLPV